VRERFHAGQPDETGGAFDGMDGAEDARERVAGRWVAFELDQVAFELIQVLAGLDDELFDNPV